MITGTEDRQHAYVALSRGTDVNFAYVFTTSPKQADPAPGPRPAPELARYDQIHTERAREPAPATPLALLAQALSALSAVLDRDGPFWLTREASVSGRERLLDPGPQRRGRRGPDLARGHLSLAHHQQRRDGLHAEALLQPG